VVTVDDALPGAEAIAVVGDRILFVGTDEEAETYRGPDTEVIDLEGRLTIPGFIEGHAHFMSLGYSRLRLDLMGTTSYEELIDMVATAAAESEPGEWIVGRGWHQSKWDPVADPAVRGFPIHDALSAVSPDNPVLLGHASGHAVLANAKAMELAGVTALTEEPKGGEILRDADGNPTGVFIEDPAEKLVQDAFFEARAAMPDERLYNEERRALRLAVAEALSKGISTFHDAGVGPDTVRLYMDALEDGDLRLRLWVMLSMETENLEDLLPELRAVGMGDNRLTVRAIKAYVDGALGSRGAWLLDPYSDDPERAGLNTVPLNDIREVVELALEHGYQVCTHAIGDRANREILDIYATAFARHPQAARDARYRIEHAQILHPNDAVRFSELGVIAAMQGIHAVSDGPWTPDRLGPERTAERAYQFRRLIDTGATVMNGTDAPVEDVNPIPSFHGAVTGMMSTGEVFNEHQLMTREEALRSYTINAAYGAHEEEIKGSLTTGKLADIVVLSHDILSVPDDEILDTRVLMTIVGGEVVYRADATAD
jgi:predicted amidohydrolase YtcJ